MAVFAALLRGVNVGPARRVAMADWRAQLVGLGYADVATLLNSGNAVFRAQRGTAEQHAQTIHAALADSLGLDIAVQVLGRARLRAIIEQNTIPLPSTEHPRLLVALVPGPAELAGLQPIAALAKAPDRFALGAEAAYLYCAAGVLQSPAGKALLGRAGAAATTRNWATVLKLQAMMEAL